MKNYLIIGICGIIGSLLVMISPSKDSVTWITLFLGFFYLGVTVIVKNILVRKNISYDHLRKNYHRSYLLISMILIVGMFISDIQPVSIFNIPFGYFIVLSLLVIIILDQSIRINFKLFDKLDMQH